MSADYSRPHISLSELKVDRRYKAHKPNMGKGKTLRIRVEHADRLISQYHSAIQAISQEEREGIERAPGSYLEIELRPKADALSLEKPNQGILVGATKVARNDQGQAVDMRAVLYVPDGSVAEIERILKEYRDGELTKRGNNPPYQGLVEPIEAIHPARLWSFWTDPLSDLPHNPSDKIWWEVWCHPGQEDSVAAIAVKIGMNVATVDYWLTFPEGVIVPMNARRSEIELLLFATAGIIELRRGSDSPDFYIEEVRETQHDWVENLAERTIWPGIDVPRVCILDSGVNRSHFLLEPALSEADLMTVNPQWVSTDSVYSPHGTGMAGLALHGDLSAGLSDLGERRLHHRLESVRIMPADGFPPNDLVRLGNITLSAVSLAEIQNTDAPRLFCMAVTNRGISGERPSSWSACIDRAAAGVSTIDDEPRMRRLFMVSGGNVPELMESDLLGSPNEYPIDDPAQSWNALTIGGYTAKTSITETTLKDYRPLAAWGDLSPYSRTSAAWQHSKTPIKPDIVFEAGNRAVAPDGKHIFTCNSLDLLTTGPEVDRVPIINFQATSAATALAARFGASLMADHPELWPEGIRGLMVHSADWTPAMLGRLPDSANLQDKASFVRHFGHGVPNYRKATASANNDVALLVQQEIQPFARREKSTIGFGECHYYPLPWPNDILQSEKYADKSFEIRVTLSYFIDPNPGRSAAVDPQNYQSYGLRFDLRRARETEAAFKFRVNAQEAAPTTGSKVEDSGWFLGPKLISAGSVHSDIWRGVGAELARRNMICVKPVSGWWRERRSPEVFTQRTRYALIVSLSSPDIDLDVYTPVASQVATLIEDRIAQKIQIEAQ